MTPAELKAEIDTGPLAAELAPFVAAGNDNDCAAMLNAMSQAVIALPTIGKGALLRGIIPALDQLATGVNLSGVALTAQISAKWTNRFAALRAGDDVMVLDAALMGLLGQLVTDGLMLQPYIDAFSKRNGSRAEVLWGAGTVVRPADIQHAMGR